MGCTIGNGFFLGSNIALQRSGYTVLFLFVLAAVATYFVFEALAKMTAAHPEQGSFRTYAKMAYGRWAGFSSGWIYWSSEMLISGSSLLALSIFTQFWFPQLPLWILSAIYAVLGLVIVILGAKGLEKTEYLLAVMKVTAIVLFILMALAIWLGWFDWNASWTKRTVSWKSIIKPGYLGMWQGLIYVFYAFAGIEVMGLMASGLSEPRKAIRSGFIMLLLVAILYLASIGLLLLLIPLDQLQKEGSPFILGLTSLGFHVLVHVFNAVLIIAGFSTMVASLYGITLMLVTLAEDGDAPKCFINNKQPKGKIPIPVLGLTAAGLLVSILMALWMPKHIFEHVATAAGLVLLYTWSFILISAPKVIKLSTAAKIKGIFALVLMGIAVSGTGIVASSRPGLWVSLLLVAVIASVTLIMNRKWKQPSS
ncbi:amino acid permease [Paenibacillus psychroresistens]|uniref:Amino acid permease n=1 Tax=Paenibacillus psychroresistens TaxID=1778678 RepID=A0A6B8RXC2_9BACL|nr:amino acid permease [Paenibacillus psychroresistens]QGQ99658.1 amino acid permease [Paenibacillus psychroresistens]